MTKKEILDYLLKCDWDDEFKHQLEMVIGKYIAKYVVYQMDPDDYSCYYYKYYISKEDAEKDFESRDYVGSGLLCYCCIASLDDNDSYFRRRTISRCSYD